jgi:hypothetical protein
VQDGAAFADNGTKTALYKDVLIKSLAMFLSNKANFLHRFITIDET